MSNSLLWLGSRHHGAWQWHHLAVRLPCRRTPCWHVPAWRGSSSWAGVPALWSGCGTRLLKAHDEHVKVKVAPGPAELSRGLEFEFKHFFSLLGIPQPNWHVNEPRRQKKKPPAGSSDSHHIPMARRDCRSRVVVSRVQYSTSASGVGACLHSVLDLKTRSITSLDVNTVREAVHRADQLKAPDP